MKRVLISALRMAHDLEKYRDTLERDNLELVCVTDGQFLKEERLLNLIPDFDGVIAGDDEFTERVLKAGVPRLSVISKWGVGLDSIDLEAAAQLGIRVFNSPGAFADPVAEVVMGYLLMMSRQLNRLDREVRAGKWPKPECDGLRDKTLGLIGFGSVGKAVMRLAMPFGMRVLATDVRAPDMEVVEDVRFCALDEILSESDFLVLACNLTSENHGMIGKKEFEKMKDGAHLVNVARGALIEETALIQHLKSRKLGGAALDVCNVEPLPEGHELTKYQNVILGSHNANNVRGANCRVHENTIRNLRIGLGLKL